MSVYFERVSRFADVDLPIPQPATSASAGFDLSVAEDIVIPPFEFLMDKIRTACYDDARHKDFYGFLKPFTLDEIQELTKTAKCKIPLVSTGMKCHLDEGQYLQLQMRSSTPLKSWLILGNPPGIVDADYYNNSSNEGEIFLQVINLLPYAIELKRGDRIAQAIVHEYGKIDGSSSTATRIGGFGSTSIEQLDTDPPQYQELSPNV